MAMKMEEMDCGDDRCNLIINYLPQELTDDDLKELFGAIGPLKSSKVVRHKQTGWSYGFGFVEFEDPVHAKQAIQTLNKLQLKEKTLKVAYARVAGEAHKNTNLYIQGLPNTATQATLEDMFKEFGTIIQAKVLHNTMGECRGTGFVLFERKDAAQKAIDALCNKDVLNCGKPLVIRFAADNAAKVRPPPPGSARGRGAYGNNNMGGPMRNQGGRFGNRFNPMTSSGNYNSGGGGYDNQGFGGQGMGGFYGTGGGGNYNQQQGQPRGGFGGRGGFGNRGSQGGNFGGGGGGNFSSGGSYGGNSGNFNSGSGDFNDFGNDDYYNGSGQGGGRGGYGGGASNYNNFQSDDFTMDTSGGGADDGHTLFCYNIGPDTEEHQMWQMFSKYGAVLKVKVIKDTNENKGKNFGFVTMSTYEDACRVIKVLDGQCALSNNPLQIRFKNDKN